MLCILSHYVLESVMQVMCEIICDGLWCKWCGALFVMVCGVSGVKHFCDGLWCKWCEGLFVMVRGVIGV